MGKQQPVTILLVEDDVGHARLIEKNIRRANVTNELVILNDGGKAWDYLFGDCEEGACSRPEPLLVLLDLNLPVIDGFRILEHLKSDQRTRHIPVVVLTSTEDERDVARCYELGCNVFMTKPVDYRAFVEAIQALGLFITVVTFPEPS